MSSLSPRCVFFHGGRPIHFALALVPSGGFTVWHYLIAWVILEVLLLKLLPDEKGKDWMVWVWVASILVGLWAFGGHWPWLRVVLYVEVGLAILWRLALGRRPPGGN